VRYFKEGISSISNGKISRKATNALPEAMAEFRWRESIVAYLHIYMVFCYATSTEWAAAKSHLKLLGKTLHDLDEPTGSPLSLLHTYVSGMCLQGSGNLDGALEMYRHPGLQVVEKVGSSTSPEQQLQRDLSILASLNSIWILQDGISFDPAQNAVMIANLEPLCTGHPTRDVQIAFNIVRATVTTNPPTPTIKTKGFLGQALEAAKTTSNKQFLAITLSVMCTKFFVGVVGDQAEKAGKAALAQSTKARNNLWMSVSSDMLADNLETQGKVEEARDYKTKAYLLAAKALPPVI
jgi:hypothetical protein